MANGDKYVGTWDRDQMNGEGTYMYVNGDKYSGEYFKGKRHGRGVLHKNGDIYEGKYLLNRLLYQQLNARTRYLDKKKWRQVLGVVDSR